VTLATSLPLAGLSVTGGLAHAQLTIATQSDTAQVQLFRAPSGGTLDVDTDAAGAPISVVPSSTVQIVDGDQTRSNLLTADNMTGWAAGTGWSVAAGVASHTAGDTDALTQSLSLADATVVRARVVIANRTAGSVALRLAGDTPATGVSLTDNGGQLVELTAASAVTAVEIVPSTDFDGDIEEVVLYAQSSSSAPQGAWDYYVAPVNADGIANAPTGPLAVTIV